MTALSYRQCEISVKSTKVLFQRQTELHQDLVKSIQNPFKSIKQFSHDFSMKHI